MKPMKPRNLWNHETYETMTPVQPWNLWNHETLASSKISPWGRLVLFKGPFTQAIFVAAIRCNFSRA